MKRPVLPVITHEMIERAAYERFLARGCEHGRDAEDWLAAEKALRRELGLAEPPEPPRARGEQRRTPRE